MGFEADGGAMNSLLHVERSAHRLRQKIELSHGNECGHASAAARRGSVAVQYRAGQIKVFFEPRVWGVRPRIVGGAPPVLRDGCEGTEQTIGVYAYMPFTSACLQERACRSTVFCEPRGKGGGEEQGPGE